MGFGLVGLHVKGMLSGESLTTSRNWPTLRVAVPPGSARLQKSRHQNKKTLMSLEKPLPEVQKGKNVNGDAYATCFACMNLELSDLVPF